MATIKHGTEDGRSGRVGNTIYRNVRGKTILSATPACYKKPDDFESLLRFQKFSFTTSLSKMITREKTIKCLWKRDDIPGIAAYHKFISVNYDSVSPDYELTQFHIAPPFKEFPVSITEVAALDKSIYLKTNPIGKDSGINPEREMYIGALGFLVYTHKKGIAEKGPILFRKSSLQKTSLETVCEFNLNIAVRNSINTVDYDGSKVIILLVTYNSEENPVRWSETYVNVLTTSPNPVKAFERFRQEYIEKENIDC